MSCRSPTPSPQRSADRVAARRSGRRAAPSDSAVHPGARRRDRCGVSRRSVPDVRARGAFGRSRRRTARFRRCARTASAPISGSIEAPATAAPNSFVAASSRPARSMTSTCGISTQSGIAGGLDPARTTSGRSAAIRIMMSRSCALDGSLQWKSSRTTQRGLSWTIRVTQRCVARRRPIWISLASASVGMPDSHPSSGRSCISESRARTVTAPSISL